jgi:hypothetical protein
LTQTAAPDAQTVVPTMQGAPGFTLHTWPTVQGTQAPAPLHTPPVHALPAATLVVVSTHVCAPVVQEVTPATQALELVLHAAPAVQGTQAPAPLHTPPVHGLPAATSVVVSTHPCAPVTHELVPTLHGAGLVLHAVPAVQGTQAPAPLHTPPAHALPAATLVTLPQLGPPPPQLTSPCVQGVGLQGALLTQEVQLPPRQTRLRPQDVPSGCGTVVSVHDWVPVAHEVLPMRQGLATAQSSPDSQLTHAPALQTPPSAQMVPFCTLRL